MNLRATLDDLDPLVADSKPATKDLAPFLRELRPLVRDAKPTIADLSTLVRQPGTDNDLVEATRKLPGFQRVASPALKNGTGALQKGQPVLEFIRPYIPELVGWFRDFGVGAANYDANGHYARIQPIFNAFQLHDLPVGPPQLVPLPVAQRLAGLQTGMLRRCPGSASQPAAGRLGAVPRLRRQPRLRPDPGAGRPMMRVLAIVAVSPSRWAWSLVAPRENDSPYQVRAIFDNAGFVIPGEDVKIAGVKVGKISSTRRHRGLQGRGRARHHRARLPELPPRRELHRAPAEPDRRALRGVQADAGARRPTPSRRGS